MSTRFVVGLGSNLGDRAANLRGAVERLAARSDIVVDGVSPIYETPPAGGPPQGPFLNGALLGRTDASARDVLAVLLEIERALGRVRPDAVRWGPRTIDLDLLWMEGVAIDEPGLCVPHPRLLERAFALRPLLDLVPDAPDPRTGGALADLGTPMQRELMAVAIPLALPGRAFSPRPRRA